MNFVIQINSGPYQTQSSKSAYFFAKNAIAIGHNINTIFFYMDGVINANPYIKPPQNEFNIYQHFQTLTNNDKSNIDKIICVSAGVRRGITKDIISNLAINNEFQIGGLGKLIDAINKNDRYILFN